MIDPIDYLFRLEQFGIKFGLENIQTLCEELSQPQENFRSVIVAGTNGKGSLMAMLDTALRAAGYRTGCYTSPHLIKLEERFVINGRAVSTNALRREASIVYDAIELLRKQGRLAAAPTFFEATTAVALSLFRRAGIELALLEVGLGGRLDATNVVLPIAAAITSIDLDHERYLGTNIRDIAREKAGVIKPGMVAVVGESKADAIEVFEEKCAEHSAHFVQARTDVRLHSKMQAGRLEMFLSTPTRRYEPFTLALRGRHQVNNAIVATRLLEELGTLGLLISPDAIVHGLSNAVWRGRLELLDIAKGGKLLLDAAHNPAAARALAAYLTEVHPTGLPIVFATMKDKNTAVMLEALAPCATQFVCPILKTSRATPAEETADLAKRIVPRVTVDVAQNCWSAVEKAWQMSGTVCAAGSLFLIGELLDTLEHIEDVNPV